MKKNFVILPQKMIFILFSLLLLLFSTQSFALPFDIAIAPGTTLPSTVVSGLTASAYYTVTNKTLETRLGNYVKYMPPHVAQVTSGGTFANTCGSSFNLAPNGQAGDTCVLQLSITDSVDSGDTDPHHQLFVCFPGGLTCSGTTSRLNVTKLPPVLLSITVTAPSNTVHIGQSLQFTATGNFSDGTTQDFTNSATWNAVAPDVTISAGGLATGVAVGSSVITATQSGVTSNSFTLTVVSFAYITNFSNSTVSRCNINSSQTFSSCATTGSGFSSPVGITLNPNLTFAYITNTVTNTISACVINTNGSFGTCTPTTGFSDPMGIAINPATDVAYVTNSSNGSVSVCQISSTGVLFSCFTSGIPFTTPTGIAINNDTAFITDVGTAPATVNSCVIDLLSEDFDSCTATAAPVVPFVDPVAVAVNGLGTFAYVADRTTGVYVCADAGGTLSGCAITATGVAAPTAVAFNPAESAAYVTTFAGTVFKCAINGTTGALTSCATAGATGLAIPSGIAVD